MRSIDFTQLSAESNGPSIDALQNGDTRHAEGRPDPDGRPFIAHLFKREFDLSPVQKDIAEAFDDPQLKVRSAVHVPHPRQH
jgi:hypothetical protein